MCVRPFWKGAHPRLRSLSAGHSTFERAGTCCCKRAASSYGRTSGADANGETSVSDGLASTACWPLEGDAPADAEAKADYFDSLYHADVIVGLNTSAMIEGAIVGRPVHTVLLPEFTESQEGTIHFHYLLNDTHGVLRATRSLDEHVDDLAATLEGRGADTDRSARFVRTFVRPAGLEIPATVRFVDELERLVALPSPAPVTVPPWTHLIRPVLWPFALAASAKARRSRESFRRQKRELLSEHRRRKAADRSTSARRQP